MDERQTIAAVITAPGQAAVSVLRLSGEQTKEVLAKLLSESEALLAAPRMMKLCTIWDQKSNPKAALDSALCVYFPAPNSFTGEDCAEFHVHGSPFIVRRLMANFQQLGVRVAEPGEFTKRAFLNGRMDLSQAEAVADIINAETEAQARVAQQQLAGVLSNAMNSLGEPLRGLLAEIEAYIDFPEEDIEPLSVEGWQRGVKAALGEVERYLRSYSTGRLYREGAEVVLAGVPNAGKSSLMNALLGEARAIVTPIPGTTRDSIDTRIDLDGLFVTLWDTAGLVEGALRDRVPDEVERIGIARSWKHLSTADLVLYLFAADQDIELQTEFYLRVSKRSKRFIALLNKIDTVDYPRRNELKARILEVSGEEPFCLSAETGDGVHELKDIIRQQLLGSGPSPSSVLICNQRHYQALIEASEALERAAELLREPNPGAEFIALEIRSALGSLSEIVGVTHTEDILGLIFSKFCIGK